MFVSALSALTFTYERGTMKAEISVRIIHGVREPEIPEKDFVRTSTIGIELPVAKDKDFLDALDSLVSGHLSTLILELCAKVRVDGDKYLERMKKEGIRQPELPMDQPVVEQPSEKKNEEAVPPLPQGT